VTEEQQDEGNPSGQCFAEAALGLAESVST
jgi:hypothetical protein